MVDILKVVGTVKDDLFYYSILLIHKVTMDKPVENDRILIDTNDMAVNFFYGIL
jgi:hypothetical protein